MPTYNEAENLPQIVPALLSLGIEGLNILVVDDNSPDGTGQVAEELRLKYPGRVEVLHRGRKLGLGTAYVTGFAHALAQGADYIFEMDADFSHPPEMVRTFLQKIVDCDVVVGSRYTLGGALDPKWSLWRRFLSWGGNVYARLVTGLKVRDTTAGFKCFRRQVLESLDLSRIHSDGYAFQVEMAYLCQKKGFRVVEVPITFLDRTHGQSKMSFRIIWEAMWRVWQLKWRD